VAIDNLRILYENGCKQMSKVYILHNIMKSLGYEQYYDEKL